MHLVNYSLQYVLNYDLHVTGPGWRRVFCFIPSPESLLLFVDGSFNTLGFSSTRTYGCFSKRVDSIAHMTVTFSAYSFFLCSLRLSLFKAGQRGRCSSIKNVQLAKFCFTIFSCYHWAYYYVERYSSYQNVYYYQASKDDCLLHTLLHSPLCSPQL